MKNTVDLDDLLNSPLVINPDDEIKENDVVITKGVVTDDDLLNAPLAIDSNIDEEDAFLHRLRDTSNDTNLNLTIQDIYNTVEPYLQDILEDPIELQDMPNYFKMDN